MGICKLCKVNPCGHVEAHIIPYWAYKKALTDGPALVVPTDKNRYIGKSRKGEYDTNLVCQACEESFSSPDNFGCRFFREMDWSKETFQSLGFRNGTEYFIKHLPSKHYKLLHRFVMSILWRASATTRPHFAGVNLGKREYLLGKMLLENRCDPNIFPFRITKFFTPSDIPILDPEHIVFNPQVSRIEGYYYARIPIYGFEIMVSTDSRPAPLILPSLKISDESIPVTGACFTTNIADMQTIGAMIKNHPA
jgi:hypothetical protein